MPNDRSRSKRPFQSDAIVRLQVPEVEEPDPRDTFNRPLHDRLKDWPRILVAVNPARMLSADGRKKIASEIQRLVTLEWNDKKPILTIGRVLRARRKLQRPDDPDPAAKSLADEAGVTTNQARKVLTMIHKGEKQAATESRNPRRKIEIPDRFTPPDPTAPLGSKHNPIQMTPKDYAAASLTGRLKNVSYMIVKHPAAR